MERQIRYLVAVMEAGSYTEAARRLGISQPTISNAIDRLEATVGAPLLVRSSRKVEPTELGQHLLPAMRRFLQAEADLRDEIERYLSPERPRVRVGLSPLVDLARVHAPLVDFATRWPGAEIIFKECSLVDLLTRLDEGTVDVALSIDLPAREGQGRLPLYEEGLRYVPPGGPSGAEPVRLREIAAHRLVLPVDLCGLAQHTQRLLQEEELQVELYAGRALSYEVVAQWAELGIGGALVPESKLPQAGRYPRLVREDGSAVTLSIEAVWRRDFTQRPHLAAFVLHLTQRVQALILGADQAPSRKPPRSRPTPRRVPGGSRS